MEIGCQKRNRRHDLTRLAIATLHHLKIEPRLLNFPTAARLSDGLDGGDFSVADALHRHHARAGRNPVDMDRARAAQSQAAAKLCPGHTEHIAQDPQQGGIAVDVDDMLSTVNLDCVGRDNLLLFGDELDEKA